MKKVLLLTFLLIITIYALPSGYNIVKNQSYSTTNEHIVANVKKNKQSKQKNGNISKKVNFSDTEATKNNENNSDTSENAQMICVSIGGKVQEMRLEDYVAGVTAAEIPVSFPTEAIKAQAIAARTFAESKIQSGEDSAHPDAAVCDNFRHCAAYLDLKTQAESQWGNDASKYRRKIEQAVNETAGQIVTYEGKPITAVFHASCSDETESALDVWGADVPYLVSVDSSGDEQCPDYKSSVTFAAEDFRQIMLKKYKKINLTGLPDTWFTDFQRASSGNVLKCTVGGVKAKGTSIRTILSLRSTNFEVSTTDTSITFDTVGYGHAVGMSQYGAKQMAENGSSCEEILTHYYTGTKIEHIPD